MTAPPWGHKPLPLLSLRCPYCGCPVWSGDDGASCTDPDYAGGHAPASRSCGATWDCVGVPEQGPAPTS